jgi:enterochelin esterase family protein
MKRTHSCLILILILSSSANSQGFQSFINYLNSIPEDQRMVKVDSFMTVAATQGFPYITMDTANFIYRGAKNSVQMAGDFNGWDYSTASLTKVAGTDFFYYSMKFEMYARLDYKYVIGGSNWILDPLNPHTCSGGFGPNSELAMPGYVQPWEINTYAGVPNGAILNKSIASTHVGKTFQLKIYLPEEISLP